MSNDQMPSTALATENSGAANTRPKTRKFLVFRLGEERFALPLNQVKEVIAISRITPVPHVPAYFKGLINLRGRIISTMDLRLKLGFAQPPTPSKRPCVIISDIQDIVLGSIVDEVVEVVGIPDENIERSLDIQSQTSREYILGAARFESKPIAIVLDIEKVLNIEELAALRNQISAQAAA